MTAPRIFDRALLVERRRRVAGLSAGHGFLLDRVADDLRDRLAVVRRQFPALLDVGTPQAGLARRLVALPGTAFVVACEPGAVVAAVAGVQTVAADEEALPFAAGSFDLVVSGLALQFVNDLPGTLAQIRRILRPDGLLLAALMGGATLTELRQSFVAAEAELEGGASPRVAPFADVRDLGGLLQRAGFALPVVDADVVTVAYPTPLHVMRELRAMGAGNVLVERRRRPLRRATLMRACEIYQQRFARPDGRVLATFEILTLTGWCPDPSQPKPLKPGSAKMRLADALGTKEVRVNEPPSD
jgi:NADH dehydrogenase [ubiquinone] 1 alpha subcomplex assembly factor 5